MEYQNLWSYIMSAPTLQFEANMVLSEKFFHFIGTFNKEANAKFTKIIDELLLPPEQRKYQPLSYLEQKDAILLELDLDQSSYLGQDIIVYKINGILYKICHYGQENKDVVLPTKRQQIFWNQLRKDEVYPHAL